MSRLGRNRSLIVALLLMGLILIVAVFTGQNTAAPQPFTLTSDKDDGLLILVRWFERMGYQVSTTGTTDFGLAPDADLLMVHMPRQPFSVEEISALDDLLAQGGTLVLVGLDANADPKLAAHFAIGAPQETHYSRRTSQLWPLLPDGSGIFWIDHLSQPLALGMTRGMAPVLLNDDIQPVAAVKAVGPGTLWLLDDGLTLTNTQLDRDEHPARYLVPALLRGVPDGGRIVFDTYHRQLPGAAQTAETPQIRTIQDWLYTNPVGWGVLFALGMIGIFVLLQGRRLGPPVPVLMESRRREAAEYVRAMAGLKRRGRYRASVAWRTGHQLKLHLGRPLHIPPDLDPVPFMAKLRQADHRLAPDQLTEVEQILTALAADPDEAHLVALAAQAQTLMGAPNHPIA